MIWQEFKKQSTRAHNMQESHKEIFVYQIQLILTLGSILFVKFGQSTVKHLYKAWDPWIGEEENTSESSSDLSSLTEPV